MGGSEEGGGGNYGARGDQGLTRGYRALGLHSGHVEVRVVTARVVEVRACGGVRGGGYVREERERCSDVSLGSRWVACGCEERAHVINLYRHRVLKRHFLFFVILPHVDVE